MRVRILKVVVSEQPFLPVQPGQIITVPILTEDIQTWIRTGTAEILADDVEATTMGETEQTVEPTATKR